jgi:glycerol-3-phosphate O-acyltransferase/dihydroxyacetone phosphate acyltransferase
MPHRSESGRHGSGRSVPDAVMGFVARGLVRTFFRRLEVVHGDRVESGRPTVLVAEHRNGLVDGLVLMAALGRYPRFLGKSTLFHNPLLWPFLKLAGVVPVHRLQDGVSRSGNGRAFARCRQLLARGGMVAIFPEGVSHDRPALQPLRTGAARVALSAVAEGVNDVETVVVTLVYDDKQRFRSRVLVNVGVPRSTRPWMEAYRIDGHRAVRAMTEDLAQRMRRDGTEFDSWSDAEELDRIADIVARPTSVLPTDVALRDRRRVAALLHGAATGEGHATTMAPVRAAYAAYRHDLERSGLDDGQLAAQYGAGRLRGDLLVALAKMVVALPPALVGAVIHAVPYQVVKRASRVPDNEGVRATVALVGCFFLFTTVYVVLGVVVGASYGFALGLAVALGAPVCGYVTVGTAERLRRVIRAVAGYRAARRGGADLGSLRARRAVVVDAASALIGTVAPGGPTPDP